MVQQPQRRIAALLRRFPGSSNAPGYPVRLHGNLTVRLTQATRKNVDSETPLFKPAVPVLEIGRSRVSAANPNVSHLQTPQHYPGPRVPIENRQASRKAPSLSGLVIDPALIWISQWSPCSRKQRYYLGLLGKRRTIESNPPRRSTIGVSNIHICPIAD